MGQKVRHAAGSGRQDEGLRESSVEARQSEVVERSHTARPIAASDARPPTGRTPLDPSVH